MDQYLSDWPNVFGFPVSLLGFPAPMSGCKKTKGREEEERKRKGKKFGRKENEKEKRGKKKAREKRKRRKTGRGKRGRGNNG
jgi:hypothetical protein